MLLCRKIIAEVKMLAQLQVARKSKSKSQEEEVPYNEPNNESNKKKEPLTGIAYEYRNSGYGMEYSPEVANTSLKFAMALEESEVALAKVRSSIDRNMKNAMQKGPRSSDSTLATFTMAALMPQMMMKKKNHLKM